MLKLKDALKTLEKIAHNIFAPIYYLLWGFSAIFSGIYFLKIPYDLYFKQYTDVFIHLAYAISILIIAYILKIIATKVITNFQRQKSLNQNCSVISNTTFEIIKPNNLYTIKFSYEIRSLINGLDNFIFSFAWRGNNDDVAIESSEGGTANKEILNEYINDIIRFKFTRPLKKGEIYNFSFILSFKDIENKMMNFRAYKVTTPVEQKWTRKIVFETYMPINLEQQIFSSHDSITPLKTTQINIDSNELVWEINTPDFGKNYKIRWDKP